MTEGGFQDGLVIEMIALGAVETLVVGILAEAGAMGEMTLRGEVISQIELVVMLDGMKKLAIGSTKMVRKSRLPSQSRQHELGCDCSFCSSFVENCTFVF